MILREQAHSRIRERRACTRAGRWSACSHAVKLTPMMLGKLLFPEVGGLTIGVSYQLATPVS